MLACGFGCWRARWGLGVELCEGAAEGVEARGAGESVLLDGAADGGGYCGVFFVGEIDCRHGLKLRFYRLDRAPRFVFLRELLDPKPQLWREPVPRFALRRS